VERSQRSSFIRFHRFVDLLALVWLLRGAVMLQTTAFLSGLFGGECGRAALIICPKSLITNWQKEFETHAPTVPVRVYHGSSADQRDAALNFIVRRGGILITTYTTAARHCEALGSHICLCIPGCMCDCPCHVRTCGKCKWDWVVLDEGHKVHCVAC